MLKYLYAISSLRLCLSRVLSETVYCLSDDCLEYSFLKPSNARPSWLIICDHIYPVLGCVSPLSFRRFAKQKYNVPLSPNVCEQYVEMFIKSLLFSFRKAKRLSSLSISSVVSVGSFMSFIKMGANVWCFAKVGISRHKSSIYPHSLIVVQMFNKPLQPHFCKARVSGWAVIK